MENQHWIILYDIKNIKRLHKVAKTLESYAHRVQKSIFEVDAPESVINQLKWKLDDIIEKEEDFLLFFNVCERDWQKREFYGINVPENFGDEEYKIL